MKQLEQPAQVAPDTHAGPNGRAATVAQPAATVPAVHLFARLAAQPPRARGGLHIALAIPSALRAIRANKGRSVLTTLGIVIGVAAVIAIVALGQGASASVSGQLQNLGTNVVTISPGSSQAGGVRGGAGTITTLKAQDATALQAVPGISQLSPVVSGNAQLIAGNENWSSRIQAVWPVYEQLESWKIAEGGFFSQQDNDQARSVAVLGQTVAANLFPGGEDPIGQRIRIRNVPFTVVGVLASKGAGFGGDQDDVVMIPFRTGQIRLFGPSALNQIVVQVGNADQIPAVSQDVTALLRERHRLTPSQADDFSIRSNTDIIQRVEGVTQTMTLLLGGVAAVSLLVGGIGIMNIMLVSVTERTREIGIRMAIGAQPLDILLQFLVEALALSLLGGLIGIGIGVGVALALPTLAGWNTVVPMTAILIAFGFSALIGVFFGIYPARRASRLDPIEALRYQ